MLTHFAEWQASMARMGKDGQDGEPGTDARVSSGLIMASLRQCADLPGNWSDFHEARGRFIVGAGDHDKNPWPDGLTVRPPFTAGTVNPDNRTIGGAETVTLTEAQMPSQSHNSRNFHVGVGVSGADNRDNLRIEIGANPPADAYTGPITTMDAGSSQPHNNMPPYIALYFCKKD
jgi:hypothetical protein